MMPTPFPTMEAAMRSGGLERERRRESGLWDGQPCIPRISVSSTPQEQHRIAPLHPEWAS